MSGEYSWDPEVQGPLLRRARKNEGLTGSQVATRVGVSQAAVSNWEKGKTSPRGLSRATLYALFGAEAFDPNRAMESGVNLSLSAWLRTRRTSKGWTMAELAGEAGVSHMTVWNIENAKTSSPRESTLKQLAKALGEGIPETAEEEIEQQAEVPVRGVGNFEDFDPHDREQWPKVPGVYVLYDISERPIYVGQSKDIAGRLADYTDETRGVWWYNPPIVKYAAHIEIGSKELREQIEAAMIKFLKSNAVLNKDHVSR